MSESAFLGVYGASHFNLMQLGTQKGTKAGWNGNGT